MINALADTGVFPSDAERVYDALAGTDKAQARSTPTTTSLHRGHAASRPTPSPSGSTRGGAENPVRVLAHFVPGDKVLAFLASESDWLDVRWCADDDADASFYRELPEAEVIWHVLRPLSGADLRRGPRLRLVHKLGAGVNTIDVPAATSLVSRSPICRAPTRRRWPRAR